MEEKPFEFRTKEEIEKEEQKLLVEKYEKSIFTRLFKYASEKIGLFIVGIIMALANGVIFPVFSIFLSRMFVSLL